MVNGANALNAQHVHFYTPSCPCGFTGDFTVSTNGVQGEELLTETNNCLHVRRRTANKVTVSFPEKRKLIISAVIV